MAAQVSPQNGIYYGWTLGESGYNLNMDYNFLKLSIIANMTVADRDLSTPPASPNDGDSYIVGATATDDWAGHEDDYATWIDLDSAWFFVTPQIGQLCYIVDEDVLSCWKAAGWSTGISI